MLEGMKDDSQDVSSYFVDNVLMEPVTTIRTAKESWYVVQAMTMIRSRR